MKVGSPYQLINYELIYTPSRSITHQLVINKFLMLIYSFLKETNDNGFLIMGPIDVVLDDGNAFQPDWVYVHSTVLKSFSIHLEEIFAQ